MKVLGFGIVEHGGVTYFSLARILLALQRAKGSNLVTQLELEAIEADEAANAHRDTIRCSCGDVIDVAEQENHDRNVHGIDPRPRLAGAKRWE